MREIAVYDYAALPPAALAALARSVQGHRTLADVLAWGRAQTPPTPVAEIVTQDEYTHDVLVPVAPARYLAYDTT